MKKNTSSLVMMEIALAVLFFALSAAVILQVFVGSYRLSMQSETLCTASVLSEDVVNALLVDEKDTDAFFIQDGFTQTNGSYQKEVVCNQIAYTLIADYQVKNGEHGQIAQGNIIVKTANEEDFVLPFSRFMAKEVRP